MITIANERDVTDQQPPTAKNCSLTGSPTDRYFCYTFYEQGHGVWDRVYGHPNEMTKETRHKDVIFLETQRMAVYSETTQP